MLALERSSRILRDRVARLDAWERELVSEAVLMLVEWDADLDAVLDWVRDQVRLRGRREEVDRERPAGAGKQRWDGTRAYPSALGP